MESGITMPFRMKDGIMFLLAIISRIDGLHTEIKAQNKIAEIQSQTHAISHGYLLIKLIKFKLPSRLVVIIAYCPYISGIHKHSTVKLPKKISTRLYIHIQLRSEEHTSELQSPDHLVC